MCGVSPSHFFLFPPHSNTLADVADEDASFPQNAVALLLMEVADGFFIKVVSGLLL